MRKYRVSERQLAWLITSYIVTCSIINLPQQLPRIALMDAWITQLFPVVYGFGTAYVFYRLAKWFPGKNFFEITILLAGRWGGRILNTLFLLHLWFILARDTMLFIGFIKTNLLLRTPYEISLLLLILVLIYYGKMSIEVSARVNDLFFVFLCFTVLLLPLLLSNDLSLHQLFPIFIEPPQDVGIANLLSTSYYGDVAAFAAFLPAISNPKSLFASFRHGLVLTAVLITWVIVTGICVLGPNIMSKEIYPTYSLIQQIHITDFLDRMEIFIFSIYFPSFIVNLTLSFFAILIGLASFTKSNNYQFYSRSAGWFLLMTFVFAFGGTPEVSIFANYGFPVFLFIVQPLALIITLSLGYRKAKQAGSPLESHYEEGKSDLSWRKWKRMTHLLIVFAFVCVIAGFIVSKDFQWLGRVCAVGYASALLAAVLTTYMEMKRASEL
jgi:spore germination protein KB